MKRVGLPLLVLLGITAAVWAPSLGGGFVWDDTNNLVRTDRLHHWSAALEVFRHDAMWSAEADAAPVATYRPMALASFVIDHRVFDGAAWGFHLSSLLWHLLATWALFAVMRRWFSEGRAAILTGIWAVHPVAVEAVGWINGRSEVLALLFGCLAVLGALHRWRGLPLVVAGLLLALLSKESAIVFIPVALAAAAEREGRLADRRVWRWLSPPALLGCVAGLLAYGLVRAAAVSGVMPGVSLDADLFSALPFVWGHALHTAVLPLDAGITVLRDWLVGASPMSRALIGGANLVLLAIAVFAWRRGRRLPAIGLGWWIGALVPTGYLVSLGWPGFQRWLYLALPGLLFFVGGLLPERPLRPLWRGAVALWVGFLVVRTQIGLQVWADDGPLFMRTVEEQPNTAFGYAGLGIWFLRAQRPAQAEVVLRRALELPHPPDQVPLALATAVAAQGRCLEGARLAAAHLGGRALEPSAAVALARCFAAAGQPEKARRFFALCAEASAECREGAR